MYAFNKNTGKELWKFKTRGAVHSSPALYDGLVIFSSHDGFVYAVVANSGELVLKYRTGGEKFYDLWDYYLSSPLVLNGVVYIGSGDHNVYALDAASGVLNWKFKTEEIVHATPAAGDSLLYVGNFDGNLYALNLSDGKLKWKFKTDGEPNFPKGEKQKQVLLYEGTAYFGSRDYNVYAVDAYSGMLKWKKKEVGSWVIATPTAIDGNLFFGTSDSEVFCCVDSKSGAEKWRKKLNMRVFAEAAAYNNSIVFGCFNGKLYAIDPVTGVTSWEFQTVGSKSNYLTVYDGAGEFKKDFQKYGDDVPGSENKILALGSILSTPVIDQDRIYFGSADGYVYALMAK